MFIGGLKKLRAFTLIEILVVIAIIAILIGILLPVIAKARKSAQRTTCAAHLSEFGKLFQVYLNESKGKLPWVRPIPTLLLPVDTFPLTQMQPHFKMGGAWECPSDQMKDPVAGAAGFERYFDRDGLSYFYNPRLAPFNGLAFGSAMNYYKTVWGIPQERLPVISDFEPFHGRPNTPGCTNHLFADMHVGDIE